MSWSCLHIFYAEPQDRLLCDAIAPLVDELRRDGVNRWFFLRYWEGGPHIRLRIEHHGDDSRCEESLEELRLRLLDYVTRHPSTLMDVSSDQAKKAYVGLAKLEGISPDATTSSIMQNDVRVANYEVEYAKYGGSAGVAIAEQLFTRSSDIALSLVAATQDARRARLGQALEMMLVGILAAGHDAASCGQFLAEVSSFWSRYVSRVQRERWVMELESNLPVLTRRVERLLSQSFDGSAPEGTPTQQWASAVHAALWSVDEKASEVLAQVSLSSGPLAGGRIRDFLLLNYLHTHNNRLGIIPSYEAYLAYLGHHAVSRCLGASPPSLDLVNGSGRPRPTV